MKAAVASSQPSITTGARCGAAASTNRRWGLGLIRNWVRKCSQILAGTIAGRDGVDRFATDGAWLLHTARRRVSHTQPRRAPSLKSMTVHPGRTIRIPDVRSAVAVVLANQRTAAPWHQYWHMP